MYGMPAVLRFPAGIDKAVEAGYNEVSYLFECCWGYTSSISPITY